MKILNILYQRDRITLTEIGKMLDIEKGSLTTLVDLLEEKGFVTRAGDPKDRRKTLICLSARGKEDMDRMMDLCAQKMDEILCDVEDDEIKQFITNLQSVVTFMSKI